MVSPIRDPKRNKKFKEAIQMANRKYSRMLKNLAEWRGSPVSVKDDYIEWLVHRRDAEDAEKIQIFETLTYFDVLRINFSRWERGMIPFFLCDLCASAVKIIYW